MDLPLLSNHSLIHCVGMANGYAPRVSAFPPHHQRPSQSNYVRNPPADSMHSSSGKATKVMGNKITMRSASPPAPETIAISIQPASSMEDCRSPSTQQQPPHQNGTSTLKMANVIVAPYNSVAATLKPCDSAPNFTQIGGELMCAADTITLNSANSSNSLLPRDEFYLEHQQRVIHATRRLSRRRSSDPEMLMHGSNSHGSFIPIVQESSTSITVQVFFPFLVAGLGMVGAGLLLDNVMHWEVFKEVSEIMVLVPSLLGLKGNLEMTLASRLSTQANLGTFDKPSDQLTLIVGNMALIECQAIVVGFLASWFAILVGFFTDGHFNANHAFMLCASSIMTAAAASILLGLLMVGVIMLSRRMNINPDNVATPIAASLGDVTSLAILAGISTLLYSVIDKMIWAGPIVIVCFLLTIPILVIISRRNKYTEDALRNGWIPVISAMIISSGAGFIFDLATVRFKNIAVFQPVVNGVGGNLVAIHASRISTYLHTTVEPGHLPAYHPHVWVNPCMTFFGNDLYTTTGRVLLILVIPGQMIFAYLICYVKTGGASLTFSFVAVYLLVSVVQVAILLYVCLVWTHLMWRRRLDPDNCSIPYLTALGDLLGVALLTLAFSFLALIHQEQIGIPE